MQRLLVIIIISSFFLCQRLSDSGEDKNSIIINTSLLFLRSNKLTISGSAIKGIVKNAKVTVSSLNKDGSCNTSSILATETTDELGQYSLAYNKTGSVVCLTVATNPNGKTTLFDEKTNADVSVSSTSTFKLVTIIPESKIVNNSRKNAMVSPFSKILGKRLQYLIKQAGDGADVNALHQKASKEIVIRFGLHGGLSAASGKEFQSPRAATSNIPDSNFPELDSILLELENPSSPLTAKFISILVGFSHLANKYKKGTTISIEDIDAMIDAFAADFEDGLFDGKTPDGKPIILGLGSNQIVFSSNPLTSILLPSVVSYFQEGGKLTVGRDTTSSSLLPTLTADQIKSQVQFVDNVTILSSVGNDTIVPIAGGGGLILTNSITANTIPITWTAGTDNVTPVSGLQYIVYYSTTAAHVSSLANINSFSPANSGLLTNTTAYTLSNLSASTMYYFNIVIQDSTGNKAIYTMKNASTNAVACAPGASANYFSNNYYLGATNQSCDSLCTSLGKVMNLTNTNLLNNNGGACGNVLTIMGCTGTTNITASCTTPSCHYFAGGPSREDCGNTMNPATAYGVDQMVCQCN